MIAEFIRRTAFFRIMLPSYNVKFWRAVPRNNFAGKVAKCKVNRYCKSICDLMLYYLSCGKRGCPCAMHEIYKPLNH
jgi:hypothetical protein